MNLYPFLGIEENTNIQFLENLLSSSSFKQSENLRNNILSLIEKHVKIKLITVITLERDVALSAELVEVEDDFIDHLSHSDDWQEYFFESYPELKSYLDIEYAKLRGLVHKVLSDFETDRSLLEFDKVLDNIEIGEGDFHNGLCTCCLKFTDQSIIFYKPRSLEGDQRVIDFLIEQQKQMGLDIFYPVKNKTIGDHGWSFPVELNECPSLESVKNYYLGLGVLAAYSHALKIEDLIYDNILCAGGKIGLIDLECILCTSLPFDPDKTPILGTLASQLYRISVINSGILPRHTYGGMNTDGESDGALSFLPDRAVADKNYKAVSTTSNNDSEARWISFEKHVPRFQGEHQSSVDHLEHFKEGFEIGYSHIFKNKARIKQFVESLIGLETRIIWRPTKIYSTVLNESFNVPYLESQNGRKELFNLMRNGEERGIPNAIINSEIEQLCTNDIPAFKKIIGTNNVYDFSGKSLDTPYYETSDLDQVIAQIERLGEADFNIQKNIIECSLKLFLDDQPSVSKLSLRRLNEHQTTEEICHQFVQDIVEFVKGELMMDETSVSLLDISTNSNNGWSFGPVGPGLSNGTDSIALLLLAYGALNDDQSALSTAHDIYSKNKALFHKLTADPSYYKSNDHFVFSPLGFPGCLFYYAAVSDELLEDSHLLDDEQLLADIETYYFNWIHKDKYFDFMLGASGGVLLFYQLYEKTKNNRFKELSLICAERVAEAAIIKGDFVYWSVEKFKELGGFSHGTSSFSVAMLMAYRLSESPHYLALYEGALKYDQSLYRPSLSGYTDHRYYPVEVANHGWAHGSAGIGISRILINELDPNRSRVKEEIEICKTALEKIMATTDNYSINGGFAGMLETLVALKNELSENDTFAEYQIRSRLIQWSEDPSLLITDKNHLHLPLNLGITGLGYSILRFLSPDKLPSYLFLGIDTKNGPKSFYK